MDLLPPRPPGRRRGGDECFETNCVSSSAGASVSIYPQYAMRAHAIAKRGDSAELGSTKSKPNTTVEFHPSKTKGGALGKTSSQFTCEGDPIHPLSARSGSRRATPQHILRNPAVSVVQSFLGVSMRIRLEGFGFPRSVSGAYGNCVADGGLIPGGV